MGQDADRSAIPAIFEARAARTPNAVAVALKAEQLTYAELNRRANLVAHSLRRRGVNHGTPVGICVDRSLEMVVGLLGILKAGGAYVPLDPAHPADRLEFMLRDAGAPVLLTEARLRSALPQTIPPALCLDTDLDWLSAEGDANPALPIEPDDLAYVMYTSGSTGRPKGVMVTHGAVIRLATANGRMIVDSSDIVGQVVNFSFDASTFEIWGALLNGARLAVIEKDEVMSPREFTARIREHKISVLLMGTALFNQTARDVPSAFDSVRCVGFGGEPANARCIRDALLAGPPGALLNVYGPTETTTFVSCHVVCEVPDAFASIPIGQAIEGTRLYVLDEQMKEVPGEGEGELFVGGESLARGYYARPDLTAERFVPSPFGPAPGARLYKTGDLVRRRSNGDIEFIGRIDQQVKIRSFRIELGEIEAVLAGHPAVRAAVVIARDDVGGDKRLCAYVVPRQPEGAAPPPADGAPSPLGPELRDHLAQTLPEYMVPRTYVSLRALPLNPNGKIDRSALPAPDKAAAEAVFTPPRTRVEEQLAGIWAEVLGIAQVGVNDDLLDLGGHSITATQIVNKVNDSLGVDLPIRAIFQATTVAELAATVESASRGDADGTAPRITKGPRNGPIPLSYAQQQLWILAQLDSNAQAYNEPLSFELPGAIDADVLEESVNEIIRRHEVLRTTFEIVDERPVQIIHPDGAIRLKRLDIRHLDASEREAEAIRIASEDSRAPFDLTKGPLIRATLIRMEDARYRLSFTLQHIITERVSLYSVFLPELDAIYTELVRGRRPSLPELEIQYADFAMWQRRWVSREKLAPQFEYWKRQLGDRLPLVQLPIARARSPRTAFFGARAPFRIGARLTEGLKALSQREGVTLFMTLVAAFKTLLYRYTGQTDMVLGTVHAARHQPETEPLIGIFLNTIVLRTEIDGDGPFEELLKRVKDVTLGAYANSEVPFEMIVEELHPTRNPGENPLFQIAFALRPPYVATPSGWTISDVDVDTGTAKFDLTLFLGETADTIAGSFEYNTDLFEEESIARMVGHFVTLLEGIVGEPARPISQLPLLTAAERSTFAEWNQTRADVPPSATLPGLFEAQVQSSPDAFALIDADQKVTYAELNARANQLANRLRKMRVGSNTRVCICLKRSAEMLVAMLAVLKAGSAYVPIDPALPRARISLLLEDARPTVVITHRDLRALLPASAPVLVLETERATIAQESEENPDVYIRPREAAYVIYTSGSTGQPKGVVIEHRNVAAFLMSIEDTFSPGERAFVLGAASVSFDLSIFELFLPLCRGGTIILARDILALTELPERRMVTLLSAVPSTMTVMLDTCGIPTSVKTVILAGEPLHQALAERVLGLGHVRRLCNIYGPTECTTYSTIAAVRAGETPTIGRAIANTRLYVLDRFGEQAPVGIPGELYIAGTGVTRGYLNRPELTAERFVPDPFSAGDRLYKTGDLVRFTPDGELEFIGRIDHQVKLRGFRIELGEIEAILARHRLVREVAVLKVEEAPGDARLVAYVVPDPSAPRPSLAETLRVHAQGLLPHFMVPASFAFLNELPKTTSGKIDRRALLLERREPEARATYVEPRDETELLIADIWRRVLQVDQLSVDDNFFDLGGNSLLLVRVHDALPKTINKPITMLQLFATPTIRSLAQVLTTESAGDTSLSRAQDRARKQKLALEGQRQREQIRRRNQ